MLAGEQDTDRRARAVAGLVVHAGDVILFLSLFDLADRLNVLELFEDVIDLGMSLHSPGGSDFLLDLLADSATFLHLGAAHALPALYQML